MRVMVGTHTSRNPIKYVIMESLDSIQVKYILGRLAFGIQLFAGVSVF